MVQRESVDLAPDTNRLTMDRKTPDSTSIEASHVTNNIFVKTHEDHLYPPFTIQWALISAQNIDLGSFLCSLKSLTLRGDQVVNLCKFHHYLSIALSAYSNKNIEVIPPFLDFYRSSPFNVLLVPPIYHILHSSFLQKYI